MVLSPIFPQIVFVFSYLGTRLFGTYRQSELDLIFFGVKLYSVQYTILSSDIMYLSKEKDK